MDTQTNPNAQPRESYHCIICGQADPSVGVFGGMPRHIGLEKCIGSLKLQLEQAQSQAQVQAQEHLAPTSKWVYEWYQELNQARAQLVPALLSTVAQFASLQEQLRSTKVSMASIDGVILNLQRGMVLQELYRQAAEEELHIQQGADEYLKKAGINRGIPGADVHNMVETVQNDIAQALELQQEALREEEADIPGASDTAGVDDMERRLP